MKIHCANFDGDWDAPCKYCGKPERDHQHHLGDVEGTRYISRMPCEEQRHEIRKQAVIQGVVLRTFLLLYNTVHYLWGLIPFKEEAKLLWQGIKHIFVTVRAILYLNKKKPK